MTIVRVKRVSRNIPTGLTPRPEEPQAIGFRLVPRPDGVCDESAAETAAPALLMEVVALCEKSNNISRQMGRIMNLPKGEFDQDMAIGLYQRVAVLRASSRRAEMRSKLRYWVLAILVFCAGIAINIWYFRAVAGSDLPTWVKFLLLSH